ncbi:S24/S26 family peptidase [Halorussus ruber]|uniref:S26 family signal peptidase n=1 Tax=Halorussus ruber TaxID=1126238 RepID=UPI00109304B6|nr:S26 family signal peptidase [Halorussus ruber]
MSSSRDGPSSDEDDPDSSRTSSDLRSGGAATDGGEREQGSGPLALVRRFRRSDNEVVVFVREMLSSAGIVLAIGLLLFAVSGVWPPMVAIESGSMEPQMQKGDLVFIMDEGRLVPDAAQAGTGIVTYKAGQQSGYKSFNSYGDVIIYKPDGRDYETPIIHRARFWVEEGENWYDEADKRYIDAENCQQLTNCPAPNAGFITKGDANSFYDQAAWGGSALSDPVKPSWVRGTAEVRIPWLGWVRLQFSGAAYVAPTSVSTTSLSTTPLVAPGVAAVSTA